MAVRTAVGVGKKVLVVDDERHIARFIQVNLEKDGMQVTTAYDGFEALERVAAEKFDLMILDIMMPGKDGLQVLKEIRMNPETKDLPVVLATAKSQDWDVFQGYRYGADLYLTKPLNLDELKRLMN